MLGGRFTESSPPGPRPKQTQLYPRRLGLLEAGAFAVAVEALAIGVLAGSTPVARTGAGILCASALLTVARAVSTWRRRLAQPNDDVGWRQSR
jgi:hypothetical protein